MTSTEMKSTISLLENYFTEMYEIKQIGEKKCFLLPTGEVITLDSITRYGAIVVEYAENEKEAALNRFEDGDLFYPEGKTIDEIFAELQSEIERQKV